MKKRKAKKPAKPKAKVLEFGKPGGLQLLPCANDGRCQECAVFHEPEAPHNKDSLYYQYKFYAAHQRWPTWDDAVAHCAPEIQKAWMAELKKVLAERGIKS